jgi:hypothetical protein
MSGATARAPVVIGAVFGNDMRMKTQVLLLCVAAAVSACNRDSGSAPPSNAAPPAKPKAPVAVKTGPTAAEQTAGMADAVSQGKSQAPVELKFELAQRPKVGQGLDINLALISQVSANPATIQVSGEDGLTLAPGANQIEIPSEEAGEVYRRTVKVTPTAEGVLLVGVTVTLKHEEVTDSKVFSIPIIAER